MKTIVSIGVLLIAIEHLYFMYFEMFAWETIGKKTFKTLSPELFTPTKGLAANQGLYNGFLAAGLVWSRVINDQYWAENVALFFLGCITIAGIYGAATASKKIFFVQALPAILCVVIIVVSKTWV